jgi:aryl-alcohol dehydrogenase-like predicted oxidoreductase
VKTRMLGRNGGEVSSIGFGCYELTGPFGKIDERDAIAVVHRALDLGITLFDTADVYGPFTNEELVGRAIKGRRDKVFLSTKFGQEVLVDQTGSDGTANAAPTRINGRPDYIRKACDASLRRLNVDYVDMYIQHRVDPDVPIEDTIGAMGELVRNGKVRHIGLSEAAPSTIRRAHAVHPLTAVESEYSLWTREPEGELFTTIEQLGIGFIAFSPLGRGFLTNTLKSMSDLAPDDKRRFYPRFEEQHFNKNQALLESLRQIADEMGITTAQLSLAWVLSQRPYIVPIPGTKRQTYVEQNAAAVGVELSADTLARLDRAMPKGVASGPRYSEADMARVNL